MLYELLAGKTPFTGDNPMAIMAQHLRGALPRLDRENSNVSPQLAAVVARTLQRSPADRYPDMHAFVEALDHPETVDITILDKLTGIQTALPFWRSQAFVAVAISLLVMAAIVIIALLAQAARGPV
jgi:serine/threonine protein kinase